MAPDVGEKQITLHRQMTSFATPSYQQAAGFLDTVQPFWHVYQNSDRRHYADKSTIPRKDNIWRWYSINMSL